MQTFTKISFLLVAFMLSALLIINGCGKGGDTPPPPNPCAGKTITVTASITNTPTGQSTGSITATGAGSTNFTYQLGNGAFQASGVFNGLAAGPYSITAKDADGCTGTSSFTVLDACTAKNIDITAVIANTLPGTSNGSITATGTNSTGFTYSKDGITFQASGVFTGLAVGNYNITVKDAEGCTKTKAFAVADLCTLKNIDITAVIVNTATGVSNGSITATGINSTGFTYQLGTGAFQASGTFTGLAIGNYNITVKDADGCLKTKSFAVADLCAAKTITVSGTVINAGPVAGVASGSINATATGSTGFTYRLGTGAFQASGNFTALLPGSYNVTAKDADGCTKTQAFTVTYDPCIGKTLGISATSTASDKCAGTGTGSVTITGTGSTGFTYQLGTGAFQASNIFNNVTVNTYAIAIKDGDGCTKSGSVTVAALPAGSLFTAVKSVLQTNCALSGCHSGATPTGGLNFTDDCTIVGSWDRIKARAVDAPTSMPPAPNPQLSATDKQKILDWITAGHNHTN
jgi:GH24 family phage-related lysozyme (muramidase)